MYALRVEELLLAAINQHLGLSGSDSIENNTGQRFAPNLVMLVKLSSDEMLNITQQMKCWQIY